MKKILFQIPSGPVTKILLLADICMMFLYLGWWFVPNHVGNPILYGLLLFGEFYHLVMSLTLWHTVWPRHKPKIYHFEASSFQPSVDIFITVAGEPVSIIRKTIQAAKNIHYENKHIYVLNDGFVAKKDNWREVELLAAEEHVAVITRSKPGGAKAGNINHALRQTYGEIIVLFDADMTAFPNFLQKTIPYFMNEKIGFVQTPQYYQNHTDNAVTAGAWDQQVLFFGPIMEGKNRLNSAFICGTNVAIRRSALIDAGGMCESSIAEDFLTSLFIHQRGWQSVYLKEVLSAGLAPQDLQSYYSQQLRWARGSLEIMFGHNPLFKRGLTWNQKIEYLSSSLYYFNGLVLLIDICMPILFLFTGLQPVAATTTSFAIFFIPFITLNLYTLYLSSDKSFTFRAIAFSQSSWTLQLVALLSVVRKKKMGFAVTPKQAQQGNFLYLVYPHLLYIFLTMGAILFGLLRQGFDASVATNIAWAIFNSCLFLPFIRASYNFTTQKKQVVHPKISLGDTF